MAVAAVEFFLKFGRAAVAALPAALARLLLLAVLIGALTLHVKAMSRFEALEAKDLKLESADTLLAHDQTNILLAVEALTTEIRGYREDLREENKLLKARARDHQVVPPAAGGSRSSGQP